MQKVIDKFDGYYSFLSNFYRAPFTLEMKEWSTVEHWYQAHKSENPHIQEVIRLSKTPGDAKRNGRLIVLRKQWTIKCVPFMYQGVKAKFDQNFEIRKKLIETEDAILIEGNTWGDTFWGECNGKGNNNLGKILMKIRAIYQNLEPIAINTPIQLEFNFD